MNRRIQNLQVLAIALTGLLVTCSNVWADPGKAFLAIRKELRAKYDADNNGRLDAAEREAMRADAKQAGERNQRRGRGRGWNPPAEWIERYDTNGDGDLDRSEQRAAFEGEQRRMRAKYDQNGDGTLDEAEKGKLRQDFEKGQFDGMERFIAMQVGEFGGMGRRGRGGGGVSESQQRWLEFDANGDGKASAEELEAIRKANQ